MLNYMVVMYRKREEQRGATGDETRQVWTYRAEAVQG